MATKQYENVLTRSFLQREYVDLRRSPAKIGLELGVDPITVRNYLKLYGFDLRNLNEGHHRTYALPSNLEGFKTLASDWHAYWLGFIAADGNIFRHRVTVKLKDSDRILLEDLKTGLSITNSLISFTVDGATYLTLAIHSELFAEVLSEWGIGQRKSLTLQFPALPAHAVAPFIRGYFDGNGSIYKRTRGTWTEFPCKFVSGSMPFLIKLKAHLNKNKINTNKLYQEKKSATCALSISGRRENLCNFARFLYTNASIFLPRKQAVFREAGGLQNV